MVFRIKQVVENLKNHKPLQYILCETDFYGLKLEVNSHTLIPRKETEELINWILNDNFSTALDIGTGSGCIAIALARNIQANILAIDVSIDALEVAKRNAKRNCVDINFLHKDIFKLQALPKVDVIISNPPYILDKEKEKMRDNVLKYEPHLALFVNDNEPLLFYKKITELAKESLNNGGRIFFEINELYGDEIINLLSDFGFVNITLKKDINDKDRMIKATKN